MKKKFLKHSAVLLMLCLLISPKPRAITSINKILEVGAIEEAPTVNLCSGFTCNTFWLRPDFG